MAEKVVSPGVFTNEVDASFLPAAIGDIGAVVVGPTVKGPALTPTVVSSFSEYVSIFGDVFKSGSSYYSYLTSLTAQNYLKDGNSLTVVRVMGAGFTGASTEVSSSSNTYNVGEKGATAHRLYVSLKKGATIEQVGTNMASMSITPNTVGSPGTTVDFVFTGSGAFNRPTYDVNTATKIFVNSSSKGGLSSSMANLRDTINHPASASLHGLPLSASYTASYQLQASMSIFYTGGALVSGSGGKVDARAGAFGKNDTTTIPYDHDTTISGGLPTATGSNAVTTGLIVSRSMEGGSDASLNVSFKLNTVGDGAYLNNRAGGVGTQNLLVDGTKDNVRYEIASVNNKKGTFSLVIRQGNDITKRKQVLETWTNLSLDPNSDNYISKVIGDSYLTIGGTADDPYLTYSGEYPQKSKYVYVSDVKDTIDYLDENGVIRDSNASASLPNGYASGSRSGSYYGSFQGGTDGTLAHPQLFYDNISSANTQGFELGESAVKDQYFKALNLLSNADEYDFNLLMIPGVIRGMANHTSVVTKAVDVCEKRGDAFCIFDSVGYGDTIDNVVAEAKKEDTNYAATYWPWVQTTDTSLGRNCWVPPSVVVGGMYAFNDKVSHEWFAPAGLNRGGLDTVTQAERKLTQANRDSLYQSNVNPIATFPGQGVVVFGQKTLQKKSSALDRVNVRRLLIRVKKFIAASSRFLLFEPNTAATRTRFLNIANPFLEQVQSQSGLSTFKVVMDETNNTSDTIDRNQLVGQILLQPTRTAEFITLDFTILPTGAAFPE